MEQLRKKQTLCNETRRQRKPTLLEIATIIPILQITNVKCKQLVNQSKEYIEIPYVTMATFLYV